MDQPQLISFDERKHDSQLSQLQDLKDFFQKTIADFNNMKIGTFTPTKNEFEFLFLDPKNYCYEKIMKDKKLEIGGGIKLNREKLFDLIEKPKDYFTLIARIEGLQDKIKSLYNFPRLTLQTLLDFFEFSQDSKIQITNDAKEFVKGQNEVYITTEYAKSVYNTALKFGQFLNESDHINKAISQGTMKNLSFIHNSILQHVVKYNGEYKKWELNIGYIKAQEAQNIN